jgi:hypothetical protein
MDNLIIKHENFLSSGAKRNFISLTFFGKKIIKKYLTYLIALIWIISGFMFQSFGQAECTAWGNINGIRVDGELMKFETSIRAINKNWFDYSQTAKERQNPTFERKGSKAFITSMLDSISINEIVEDIKAGKASINIKLKAEADTSLLGTYFTIELPNTDFSNATFKFIDKKPSPLDTISEKELHQNFRQMIFRPDTAKGLIITSKLRRLEVKTEEPIEIFIVKPNPNFGSSNTVVYFTLIHGNAIKGDSVKRTFTFDVSGKIDDKPITLKLDASKAGREFDGIGGNFRLQDPETDPQVIDYCLKNLNITWGRVELPWFDWQRDETVDPIEVAKSGNIDEHVLASMKMAQRLAKKNIHIILSVWYPPAWAVEGKIKYGPHIPGEPFGNQLNQMKMRSIVKSLGDYLVYLKDEFGVTPDLFSFNESDLGINVRQTGKEHDEFIKQFGAYLASKGISTKLLLGDNSDANTYGFVSPALKDKDARPYIGAVSFHSWRGYDNWTLSIWADIAKESNLPLIVAEGSTDAAAWRYPDIFLEPSYALNEIDMYLRIYSICQAKSILQWQLTSDYSVLTGGGIYGTDGPLKPTQRFWNLKQLGITPKGSFYLPISCNRPNVSCVAFGDIKDSVYTIHIVNEGAERKVILTGLPDYIKELRMYVTDQKQGMSEVKSVSANNGKAQFNLESDCFTTLINK